MTEYISRDKALKVIDALDDISDAWGCAIPMHTIKEKIKEIPAADVRHAVHGKWLDRSSGWTFNSECNKCGFIVHEQFIKTYKYCPNCGADMRGEKDV